MNPARLKLALLTGAALAVLPTLGWAQTAAAPAAKPDEIVVTGSRLVTNGAQAPTPVTVMTSQELVAAEPSSIPDALNDLPVFKDLNPSTENIARHIYGLMKPKCLPLRLKQVQVWESDTASVIYYE